ncbi:Growth/differentiation factor 5 [Oryzias melastigma]|uniref:Growth/differentiation factor 15-like n=1 Tax=Oryzias melastigma TaxID=30732 RepID=A0A3B3BIA5_ORYME|nr:gonadal somatic cell derived factor [Oryzias melastigma]KAF6733218.1 Growth/differentiation factor 5 [Oryzias melastigma]
MRYNKIKTQVPRPGLQYQAQHQSRHSSLLQTYRTAFLDGQPDLYLLQIDPTVSSTMSLALIVLLMLHGSSVVIAFVLHPLREESPASPASAVSHRRCQDESLQSFRKSLLEALSLQTEPRLPAGELDAVREQWQRTFNAAISQSAQDGAAPVLSSSSVSPDSENDTSLECCSMATEVFMKDLGWDNWVIHPLSLTVVRCARCDSSDKTVQCPAAHDGVQNRDSKDQMSCCKPTSLEMVPIVFMDETSTIVISSVQLARGCGCGPGSAQQPSKK